MRVIQGNHNLGTSGLAARLAAAAFGLTVSTLAFASAGSPNTSNGYNLPPGVTELSHAMFKLHMEVFWVCVVIAVGVFGAMIYSLVKFRHSQGAVPDTNMVHSTKVEIIWTIVPVLILVAMAIPAAEVIIQMEDSRDSKVSVRVTGYQWKWEYSYMDEAEGIDFYSTLDRASNFAREKGSGIDPTTIKNYLLEVDHPLVVPSGTKVRLLLTSQDVIHAWYVPDFGAKRSAIPGYVNELWFKVDAGKEGIYRGQCAALCGRDHGFMPVVVDVRTPDDYKKWVAEQKAQAKQAAAGTDAAPERTAQVLAQ